MVTPSPVFEIRYLGDFDCRSDRYGLEGDLGGRIRRGYLGPSMMRPSSSRVTMISESGALEGVKIKR